MEHLYRFNIFDMEETRILSEYLSKLDYGVLDKGTVEYTKRLFLDWVGSAIAGIDSKPVKILYEIVKGIGNSGNSTVFQNNDKFHPIWAGMLNAASSHVVEMDDLHRASILHPGSPIISPVVAFAEDIGIGGKEVITAIVAGYEAGIRVGEALGPAHYKFFHTTATAGTFGAAAALCHLFRCSTEQMIDSFGNAGTQAAGVWEFLKHGAYSKQLHTAKAAFNGSLSAILARKGFTGAKTILEGEKGFIRASSSEPDISKITENLGNGFKINETSIKFFASCRHTHPALDAVSKVYKTINPEKIQKIKIFTYRDSKVLVDKPHPVNPYQAKFSLQFTVSYLLLRGQITPEIFTDENLRDPELQKLMDKIEVLEDHEYTVLYPFKWASRVVFILDKGIVVESRSMFPKGDPENPLSDRELIEKFNSLTEKVLSSDTREKIVEFSLNLEKVESLAVWKKFFREK